MHFKYSTISPLGTARTFSFPSLHMKMTAKHVQYSLLAGLTTVFGLTVAFANADTPAVPALAQTFVMTSPNTVTEGPFAGAKFDIIAYMSHPCYEISGTEVDSCAYSYNVTEPLKTFVDNGTLLAWVTANGLMPADTVSANVSSMSTDTASGSMMGSTSSVQAADQSSSVSSQTAVLNSTVDSEADFDNLRAARSTKLWNLCITKYSQESAAMCYQNNIRLLMRLTIALDTTTIQ